MTRGIAFMAVLVACTTTPVTFQQHALSATVAPCGCVDDADHINYAIQSLGPGGTVTLAPGDFLLTATDSRTAVLIDGDNVHLQGSGWSTRLLMADGEGVNAVLITGQGNTVSDLYIDCNRANGIDNPNIWDLAGVRSDGVDSHSTTVTRTHIIGGCSIAAHIWGDYGRITNNRFGNTRSDTAELVGGQLGWITGNLVVADGTNAHGLTSDSYDQVTISNNHVLVTPTGTFTQAVFRDWWGTYGHAFIGNTIVARGPVARAFWTLGYHNQVVGNSVMSSSWSRSDFGGGAGIITGNHFSNHVLNISPNTPSLPIILGDNVLINSEVNQ